MPSICSEHFILEGTEDGIIMLGLFKQPKACQKSHMGLIIGISLTINNLSIFELSACHAIDELSVCQTDDIT